MAKTAQADKRHAEDSAFYASTEWKPIPGYPEYEASCCGHIARVIPAKTHRTPRILKTQTGCYGHHRCKLLYQGKKSVAAVSRLVLLAWVGPSPGDKYHACHNDGNPHNNHVTNLRWDTCAGNLADRNKHGTSLHGDRNGRAKMTWEKIRKLRQDHENGYTGAELSRKYNLAQTQVYEIIHKESWWPDAGK
jgi:hypothetical protein